MNCQHEFHLLVCPYYKWWNRELTLKCKLKYYVKPMKDPPGVSPSKGIYGTTRTHDLRIRSTVTLPTEQRGRTEKVGDDLGSESRHRESKGTYECCAAQPYELKWWNRELTLKCKFKCYVKPMKDPLGVSPSKGNFFLEYVCHLLFHMNVHANPNKQ